MGEEEPVTPVVPAHAALNLRRTAMLAAGVGIIALVVLIVIGHPLAGVFMVIGLTGGWLDVLAMQRSVARFATGEHGGKRIFIGRVFMRLGVFTLIALAVAFLVRPDGLGLVAGLAVFQILMVSTASVPVFKELRGA